ncbi:endoplasmic reticulum vesicle transporter-domain-containing protein [Fusarium flagelliforme]|uniref:Endoplasmic reticulum-Golgi intermediate compartment protein n=1 Tax=Fusarium flagelliforme TaxID=2675880 RepID=A0A395M962_9HYPO|nr:endoplasmic reticulum vesicle transporter-domain-containing protein [Fusarium flagelliforme]KAH7193750.1 endoplasmic reticulum vesicle transporter-domain-containing protein [Fusarium flagelliforme]RFN44386.1 copii-coated vesicle protein (erv41) [Fusarium flagelliforme]
MMNGMEKSDFDEDKFGPKEGGNLVAAFDAFPKSKPQYIQRTSGGGKWTVAVSIISLILIWGELGRWWRGAESHNFEVEAGVSREMQINLDIVVKMNCDDLHVNVQDASGDRIMAAKKLRFDKTLWGQWADNKGVHKLGRDAQGRVVTGQGYNEPKYDYEEEGFGEEHVHDIVALGKKRAKWAKTPRFRGNADSCRIYGSLDLNKVQGDFHITARGHGYMGHGEHLDHSKFNFSHIVSELSYGPFYPSLVNPLDGTVNTAETNFHKFQYYLSVVPTVYSVNSKSILTNQYAVTEQSKAVDERWIPGVFVKYDIEPILLTVHESRDGIISLLVKIINIISGVLVAGHWGFTLSDWIHEVIGRRRRSNGGTGFLGTKEGYDQ